MKIYLSQREYLDHKGETRTFHYRPDTSDEKCMKEVLDQECYGHKALNFHPMPGDKWLDLGANIGSFSFWCMLHGATTVAYEPDPLNFRILQKNIPNFWCTPHQMAVTVHNRPTLPFFTGTQPGDFYRASCLAPAQSYREVKEFRNLFVKKLCDSKQVWSGIKMDIEGAEFGMIDQGLIPSCNMLVMEYHLSHDNDMAHFRKRVRILKKKFKTVYYIKSMDQEYPDDRYPGLFDRFVWCRDPK